MHTRAEAGSLAERCMPGIVMILYGIDNVVGKNPCDCNGYNAKQQNAGQYHDRRREQPGPQTAIVDIQPFEHRSQAEPQAYAQNKKGHKGEENDLYHDGSDASVGQAL